MSSIRPFRGPPRVFAYKNSWLAVRANSNAELAEFLQSRGMADVEISAPLRGWVFVVGGGLTDEHSGAALYEEVKALLESVSAGFGAARYFSTHRVVDYHCWARADGGKLLRFYWSCPESDELEYEWGEVAKEERRHLKRNESGWRFVSEDAVMDLAGVWSVAPVTFSKADFAKLWKGGLVIEGEPEPKAVRAPGKPKPAGKTRKAVRKPREKADLKPKKAAGKSKKGTRKTYKRAKSR